MTDFLSYLILFNLRVSPVFDELGNATWMQGC